MRHTILAVVTLAMLLTFPSVSRATDTFCEEQWELYRAQGIEQQMQRELEMVDEFAQGRPLTDEQIISGIDENYGLSPAAPKTTGGHVSPLLNLDRNDVIDERDILGLGYQAVNRTASTTVARGTGTDAPKTLVVLLKFPDQNPTNLTSDVPTGGGPTIYVADGTHNTAWAEDHWFDLTEPTSNYEDTSVAYYYKAASYGKYEMRGDVFNNADFATTICDSNGWITSAYNRSDIDQYSDPDDVYDAIAEALDQMDDHSNIDFSDYDSNDDGVLDGLVFIFAGESEYGPMWSYRWINVQQNWDGVLINSGIWASEECFIRTWCHEYGHELGLPDLYDVGGSSSGDDMPGTGMWGLMGTWYNNQGLIPPLPTGWSRLKLGFVEPVDILTTSSPVSVTVNRATASSADNTLYRVWRNGAYGKEYFLVEFRDTDHKLDQKLFGSGGLCIWHINEDRTSANNHDNAFNPQRVWLECADEVGDPLASSGDQLWRDGHNGADGYDYFADSTTPNTHDYDGAVTGVVIEPTTNASGSTMTVEFTNTTGTQPSLSWIAPASGATVSGNATVQVSSNATNRVEYYVNDCLKHVDTSSPYSSITWDTTSTLNGTARLRVVAYNTGGTDAVRVIERTVTVSNATGSGQMLPFSDNFNGYSSDTDNTLLGSWNLHEDYMGLDIQIRDENGTNWNSNAICFAQTGYPDKPSNENNDDPNAGVYTGEDDEWLMTPRLSLLGFNSLNVAYKLAFSQTQNGFYLSRGEDIMTLQISNDDGATWEDLESTTTLYLTNQSDPHYTGYWDIDPDDGLVHAWANRQASIPASYEGDDVYLRFIFYGGRTHNAAIAIDDFQVSGTALPLDLTNVSPSRATIGSSVTLTGAGFHATQDGGSVRFNNGAGGYVTASITSWSNATIVCTVPSGAVSHTDGVWVRQDGIDSDKLSFSVILDPPNITGVGQQ